jgi:glycosyltransferase involved in cell wall biosynthesis
MGAGAEPGPSLDLVIDLRPLQEPERAPITASYLARLAGALAAQPVPGERIVAVLRARRPDPLASLAARGLPVVARRTLPPVTRLFRPTGMLVDAVMQRVAQVRSGGRVYHAATGPLPLASAMPVVATLLDLAPWELPERYAANASLRWARALRARALRGAARVIVVSPTVAEAAARLVGLDPERVRVVPLAAGDAFRAAVAVARRPGLERQAVEPAAELRARLGLPERYLVVGGRYDARSDLLTTLQALAALRREEAPPGVDAWPPRVVLVGALDGSGSGGRVRALLERAGVADLASPTAPLDDASRASVLAGAVGHVQPARSDATGLAAVEALAAGVPVIASRVGALADSVGSAGILVEPLDVGRMTSAMRVLWEDGPVVARLRAAAREPSPVTRRTWSDVVADTRVVYAEAASAVET